MRLSQNYAADGLRIEPAGTPPPGAVWPVSVPEDEFYEVTANWRSDASYGSLLPYIIAHADGTGTALADQTGNGWTWMPMGSYRFEAGGTAQQSIAVTLPFLSQAAGRRKRDQQNQLPAARPPG
jgi:hypothetical protein